MRRTLLRAVLFSIIAGLVGVNLADAGGPGGRTIIRRSGPTKTVTTTVISGDPEVEQFLTARYEVITVEIRWLCFRWTNTQTTFTATLDFTGYGLNDGDTVIFSYAQPGGQLIELGTVQAVGQIATLSLSSKNGDTIPQIQEGYTFAYNYPLGGEQVLEDFFGPAATSVTTCGTSSVPR